MKVLFCILSVTILAACSPMEFTDKPMQPIEGGGDYTYDVTSRGLTVYSRYQIQSFPPSVSATAVECRRIVELARLRIEKDQKLSVTDQPQGEIRVSSTYKGHGRTACTGMAFYPHLVVRNERPTPHDDQDPNGRDLDHPLPDYPFAVGPRNGDAIALLVGISDYRSPDIPDVRYAHNDMAAMRQFLTKTMGVDPRNILELKDATKADMEAYFGNADDPGGRLADMIRPGRSEVFVYYSGHGVPGPDYGGYLLPADGHADESRLSAYDSRLLIKNLNRARPKRATVLLDTCFSGLSGGGVLVRGASPVYLHADLPGGLKNGVLLSAAAGNQIASWDDEARLGLFTRYFLEGAAGAADRSGNNDRKVSLFELEQYLRDEVAYQARSRYGRRQIPEISADDAGAAFVPVTNPGFPGMATAS